MMDSNEWIVSNISRGPIRGKDKNRVGLVFHVRARPEVEQFFQGLSDGKADEVESYGEGWSIADAAGQLRIYMSDLPNENSVYTLNSVAQPLLLQRGDARLALRGGSPVEEYANLSFLRAVGISQPDGVKIGFTGAFSSDYIRRLKVLYPVAIRQFLQDYVVPVTIQLAVLSK